MKLRRITMAEMKTQIDAEIKQDAAELLDARLERADYALTEAVAALINVALWDMAASVQAVQARLTPIIEARKEKP